MWYLPEMTSKLFVLAVLALAVPASAAPAQRPIKAAAVKPAPAPDPAGELIVEYQRVGHEIVLLQRLRGTDAVADLWAMLHQIDLDKGLVTADGRANAALTFAELHDKIERRRGVMITKACLDNPVAADCH